MMTVQSTAPTTAAPPITPSLVCERVSVGYHGQPVVREINLELAPGRVAGLFGANGAGKTTLLLGITGLLPLLGGDVRLDGRSTRGVRTHELVSRGLSLVPDDRALFTQLTTYDNLRLAHRKGGLTVDEVFDLFPSLRRRQKVRAGQLSGGEQQMLALGRGLMSRPKVLMVDEMSMGLAPLIVQELLPTLRGVAVELGTAVLLVEQHVRMALRAVDHVYGLVHGELRIDAPIEVVDANEEMLHSLYLAEGASEEVADEAEGEHGHGR